MPPKEEPRAPAAPSEEREPSLPLIPTAIIVAVSIDLIGDWLWKHGYAKSRYVRGRKLDHEWVWFLVLASVIIAVL